MDNPFIIIVYTLQYLTVVFDDFGTITCIAWCACGRRPGSRSPRVPRTLGYLWRLLADFEHRLRPEFFYFRSGPRPGALYIGVLRYYNLAFGRA